MLVSILIYVFMIKQLTSNQRPKMTTYYAILVVVVWILFGLFRFRRKLVKKSELVLVSSPDDPVALRRWKSGYILTYAFSQGIAGYGLVLHFLGFGIGLVAPFLVAGFGLIVFYSPRLQAKSA